MASKEYFDSVMRVANKLKGLKEFEAFQTNGKHRFYPMLNQEQREHLDNFINDRIIESNKNMSLEEFNILYRQPNKNWKFDLFKIQCVKCGSDRVEFNGDMEVDTGYYEGEYDIRGCIVIKCHGCGNAFTLSFDDVRKD